MNGCSPVNVATEYQWDRAAETEHLGSINASILRVAAGLVRLSPHSMAALSFGAVRTSRVNRAHSEASKRAR